MTKSANIEYLYWSAKIIGAHKGNKRQIHDFVISPISLAELATIKHPLKTFIFENETHDGTIRRFCLVYFEVHGFKTANFEQIHEFQQKSLAADYPETSENCRCRFATIEHGEIVKIV